MLQQESETSIARPFAWHIARYRGKEFVSDETVYTEPHAEVMRNLRHSFRIVVTELFAGQLPVAQKLTECRHCGFYAALNQAPADLVQP